MGVKPNGSVIIGVKLHQVVAELAPEHEKTRQAFFGEITQGRFMKLVLLAHLWRINHDNCRLLSEIRCRAFPNIEFIHGECPKCKLIVDEKYYPVRQRLGDGPWKCSVCGEEELT